MEFMFSWSWSKDVKDKSFQGCPTGELESVDGFHTHYLLQDNPSLKLVEYPRTVSATS